MITQLSSIVSTKENQMSTLKEHTRNFDKAFFLESFPDNNKLKPAVKRPPSIPAKIDNQIKAPTIVKLAPVIPAKREDSALETQSKWSTEDQALIDLFHKNKSRLPLKPYILTYKDGYLEFPLHVNYPAEWYTKLEEQITQGPQGDRVQNGLLQRDLKKLTEHLGLLKNSEVINERK